MMDTAETVYISSLALLKVIKLVILLDSYICRYYFLDVKTW